MTASIWAVYQDSRRQSGYPFIVTTWAALRTPIPYIGHLLSAGFQPHLSNFNPIHSELPGCVTSAMQLFILIDRPGFTAALKLLK